MYCIEHMFDQEYETIPSNLEYLQTGPELGGVLACIEVDRVSPYDRVEVLRAHDRQAAYHEAERYRAMTSIVDAVDIDDPRWAAEAASAEIQCALNLTRQASERELSFALDLWRRLPGVWLALAEGRIDVWRARVIADRTVHLSVGDARQIAERIIDHAPHLTTGQLRARIDRLCLETNPGNGLDRYRTAVKDRRVVAEANSDGTGNLLGLDLPPHRIQAASRRVNRMAKRLKTKGETRSMDQLRADVFLDLLSGKTIGGKSESGVHLQVDLDTLAALSEHPGELNGYGPVIADIARQVTQELDDAEWRWSVTDTASGQHLHTGVTRRRPDRGQRRAIEERSATCIFPGCRMPSVDCDIDHGRRWTDGGSTCECNLAPLCRHNHIHKDRLEWRYRPISNGDYLWTSRLGHTYTTSGTPP